ncbi:type IV pilus biogenesis/stability protein PilW [Microbulbifer hydrolyticus]|uniref:Type IV pilus assembly protein PilF n=1 Tax=Microbulbifer hydrolyticus TaxID=48074 RepID=A0A6P1TDU0_9GAMM|nr:type IV pilus biogenesis/stability protein PilW [Microbulbifer hydrolyticus]MBB5212133.1 type IV pilus assembly protein PilF [Microbulbifer hydrolyticus]QHQ39806.1 type IV pilus biogenesis/stability protein PilW [Microbulbifer hydrolyticus]
MLARISNPVAIAGLLVSLILGGCVTTGPGGKQVDLDKARETHVQLGLRYLQSGGDNREMARHHFQQALSLGKKDPQAHHGLALLYQADGELAVAESHFKKALRYDRDFSMARVNYGAFLYQQERYLDAKEQFLEASEDLAYNRRSYALANLGRAELKLHELDGAEQAFKKALALSSDLPIALLELAELKFEKQEYTQAKQYLDRFSEKNRQVPQSLWLGIRIEKVFGNRDKERSYALALKNLFPYSEETLKYQQMMAENEQQ